MAGSPTTEAEIHQLPAPRLSQSQNWTPIPRLKGSKLHAETHNGEVFYTLKEACVVIEQWRRHYNSIRPHSSLGYHPPAPEVVIWPAEPSSSAPIAHPAIVTQPTMH